MWWINWWWVDDLARVLRRSWFHGPWGMPCHRGFLNPYFPSWCWRTQSMLLLLLLQLASRNYASPNFPQQSKVRNRGDEPSSSYYFLLLSSRGCIEPQKHNQNCEERKNTNGTKKAQKLSWIRTLRTNGSDPRSPPGKQWRLTFYWRGQLQTVRYEISTEADLILSSGPMSPRVG